MKKYKKELFFLIGIALFLFVIGVLSQVYPLCKEYHYDLTKILNYLNNFGEFLNGSWKFITIIDSATSVALAILAFLAYKDYIKQEDDISFEFEIRDNKDMKKVVDKISFIKYLGYDLKVKRKQINRAEVLGILGMIKPKSTDRYNYDTKLLKDFMKNILYVSDSRTDVMIIPMMQSDFNTYFKKD
ncbi:hypothetical protein FE773_08975 [Caminibacter mediatlanticus TB-2]|uniref:Uncharacterized protein n=1 Tax=Caminibacter mediatlanticus TB-2 TaxID=391592 RepID=A0ABX5VDP0_9BACT|nr:hypothetical protein [Caminibacter mediatlanticus]QCT95319.1 hypothetical protein FE773_08975 [Caminibacter mediatlanticus TB-2]